MDPELSLPEYAASLWKFIHTWFDTLSLEAQDGNCALEEMFEHVERYCLNRSLGPANVNLSDSTKVAHDAFYDRDLIFEFQEESGSALLQNPLIVAGYDEYIREAKYALELRTSEELPRHMVRGLNRLSNLRAVSFEDEHLGEVNSCGRAFDSHSFKPLFDSGSPFKRSWHPMYLLPFNRYGFKGRDHEYEDNWDSDADPTITPEASTAFVMQFQVLLQAISQSNCRISQLNICSFSTVGFPIVAMNALVAGAPGTILQHMHGLLGSVDTLKILATPSWDRDVWEYHDYKQLRTLLSSIPKLAHLDLQVADGFFSGFRLANLLSHGFRLRQLRSISLKGITITSRETVKFILLQDLESLKLEMITLGDDDILEGLRVVYRAVVQFKEVQIRRLRGRKDLLDDGSPDYMIYLYLDGSSFPPLVVKSAFLAGGLALHEEITDL